MDLVAVYMVVSVGIILFFTTIRLCCHFCTGSNIQRRPQEPRSRAARRLQAIDSESVIVDVGHGIDEETLKSYPKLLYSEAKLRNEDSIETCCSICLADYKSSDKLRLLPDCNHVFHLKCVDPWLRLHSTCPLCRTSPIPMALSNRPGG